MIDIQGKKNSSIFFTWLISSIIDLVFTSIFFFLGMFIVIEANNKVLFLFGIIILTIIVLYIILKNTFFRSFGYIIMRIEITSIDDYPLESFRIILVNIFSLIPIANIYFFEVSSGVSSILFILPILNLLSFYFHGNRFFDTLLRLEHLATTPHKPR